MQMSFLYENPHFSTDLAENQVWNFQKAPHSKNGELGPIILQGVVSWLVSWSDKLAKWAEITMFELIWKVGMKVLNGP